MYLSRERGFLFIHIPKTGGTSLALSLAAQSVRSDNMLGDAPKPLKGRAWLKGVQSAGRLWKHSKLNDLYGLIDQEEIERLFIFTLVRNPWDRWVSYYHWLKEQAFDHLAVTLAKSTEFSEFIRHPQTSASIRHNSYRSYVVDKDGIDRCQLYLRLENLSEDTRALEGHLGLSLGKMPHVNISPRSRDWRPYYCKEDADFIANICAEDIAQFKYKFD